MGQQHKELSPLGGYSSTRGHNADASFLDTSDRGDISIGGQDGMGDHCESRQQFLLGNFTTGGGGATSRIKKRVGTYLGYQTPTKNAAYICKNTDGAPSHLMQPKIADGDRVGYPTLSLRSSKADRYPRGIHSTTSLSNMRIEGHRTPMTTREAGGYEKNSNSTDYASTSTIPEGDRVGYPPLFLQQSQPRKYSAVLSCKKHKPIRLRIIIGMFP